MADDDAARADAPETIDGEAEEVRDDAAAEPMPAPPAPPVASTALDVRPASREVIRPLDAAKVVQAMEEHQALLRQILDPSDWQGKPDAKGSFVKKSGWRKVALAYNLNVVRVGEEVERDGDGKPLRASYTARAIAPNGRAMEATGHCAFAESRFSGERGNTSKLENDMRATAETRAKNRAISDLIGMGKVSAEEVDAGSGGDPIKKDTNNRLSAALMHLLDNDEADARAAYEAVEKACNGSISEVAGQAVLTVARAVAAKNPKEGK